jgi:hypothetical protein
LSPYTAFRGHACQHDRLRAAALRVRMREMLTGSKELAVELKKLEAKLTSRLDVHETAIVDVLRRIMQLLDPAPLPPVPEKSMGFHTTMKHPVRKK